MVVTLILIEIIGAVILYLVLSVVGWLIVNPLIDRRVYGKIPDDWFHFFYFLSGLIPIIIVVILIIINIKILKKWITN